MFLYFSNWNPSEVILIQTSPSMKTSVDMFHSSKPLFEALSRKFAEVVNSNKLQFIRLQPHAHFFQQTVK